VVRTAFKTRRPCFKTLLHIDIHMDSKLLLWLAWTGCAGSGRPSVGRKGYRDAAVIGEALREKSGLVDEPGQHLQRGHNVGGKRRDGAFPCIF